MATLKRLREETIFKAKELIKNDVEAAESEQVKTAQTKVETMLECERHISEYFAIRLNDIENDIIQAETWFEMDTDEKTKKWTKERIERLKDDKRIFERIYRDIMG